MVPTRRCARCLQPIVRADVAASAWTLPVLGQLLELVRAGEYDTTWVTCAGINACVTVGRLQEAQQTMDEMRAHSSPDVRAFNILIKGYSRAGDVAALQRTLQSIRSQVVVSCMQAS